MTRNSLGYVSDFPLRVAVVGMGGFAAAHHAVLHRLEREGKCCVLATCDPTPTQFPELQRQCAFTARSIAVYTDYLEMLDAHCDQLDLVCVPTPISLHAPMHRACIERGLACYLEKPPTLCWQELEDMLLVEQAASYQTQVGFAYISEEPRLQLKQRLLDGEFGRLQRACFTGQHPRDSAYYHRTPWAGRLTLDGGLVLDSCIGNAMSHFVHNLLHWCGTKGLMEWESAESVEAELYRGHDIENFDTCFVRGRCHNGVKIGVAATHTGEGSETQIEWLECEDAIIRYSNNKTIRYDIHWRDGRKESKSFPNRDPLTVNLLSYMSHVRGELARPSTRLIDTRPFVQFSSLIYIAAGAIHEVPEVCSTWTEPGQTGWVRIEGMRHAVEDFGVTAKFPSEVSCRWGKSGGSASLNQLDCLSDAVSDLLASASATPR